MVQAALTGQGVVLARLPLVAESLANGDLVEPLPHQRMDSPMAYWLIAGPRSAQRPEIKAFCEWLHGPEQGHARDHRRSAGPGHRSTSHRIDPTGCSVRVSRDRPDHAVVVQDRVQRHVVRLGLEVVQEAAA